MLPLQKLLGVSSLRRSGWCAAFVFSAAFLAACGGTSSPDLSYKIYSARSFDSAADDLVTAGFGIAKLKAGATTTALADPLRPTAAEIRRNLILTNVATTSGTWTNLYGPNIDPATELPNGSDGKIAGDEIIANIVLGKNDAGDDVMSSVILKIPASFDTTAPCVMAVSTGGTSHFWSEQTSTQWALARGCAAVIAEKSTGPGIHDLVTNMIVAPDGTTAAASGVSDSRFTASLSDTARSSFLAQFPNRLAYKWAMSRWNPESHAGDAMLAAIRFSKAELVKRPWSGGRTVDAAKFIVLAYGVSGGGGAVVAAAEKDTDGLISGVVANAPQTQLKADTSLKTVFDGRTLTGTARTLDDYFSLSTLWQPCAFVALHPETTNQSAINRCAALRKGGLVSSDTLTGQAAEALAQTRSNGWIPDWDSPGYGDLYTFGLLGQYGHFGVEERLCNMSIAPTNASGEVIQLTDAQRAMMAVTYRGGKPSFGYSAAANVVLINDADPRGPRTSASSISPSTGLADGNFDGALCLRRLVTGTSAEAARVRAGVAELLMTGDMRGKPAIFLQGRNDTTLPVDFTVRPYVAFNQVKEGGRSRLSYIEFTNVDHVVDGLYSIRALEAMLATLKSGAQLPPHQVVRPIASTSTYPKFTATPAETDRITVGAGVLTIPK